MDTASEPAPEPAARFSIARLFRRVIGLTCCVLLIGVIAAESFAWLLPQRLMDSESRYVQLVSISFFLRVFQFHVAVAAAVLALTLLLARWRWWGVVGLIVAATLLLPYARDYAPKHPPAAASKSMRLMSINLFAQNRDEAAIMRSIDAADPDVIILVEVTGWAWENVIRKHLLTRYAFVNQPRADGVGLVLTRLPCRIGPAVSSLDGEYVRHPVLFDIGGTDVALYSVHLVSPGHTWLVERNRQQTVYYSDIARAETHPMIIAGDCNFSQLTPNAAELRRAGFRSSHELIGFGLGNTWGPRWSPRVNRLPGVRIDHIWLSPQLTATSHAVGLDTGSDHRPIIADIALSASAPSPSGRGPG